MNTLWNEIASRAGVTLNDHQHVQLSAYLTLLLAANATMNLTRITDPAEAELQHVGDSLTVLPYLPPLRDGAAPRLADVGSGGGAPGIPLAIARPDLRVLLIESTKKKAVFLRKTIADLELSNVQVTDQRAEDVGQSDRRETFDVTVARAVATMNWLAEWCLPLVKRRGKMLAMKGPKLAEELPAAEHTIRMLGGGSPDVRPVALPGVHNHVIIEIPKVRRTPARFPRLATDAKGRPLS